MRIDDRNYIYIDAKIQDKFRERLANLDLSQLKLKCVILGDSDFDYSNTKRYLNTRVLNAPYNVEGVKYPLFYEGGSSGLEGFISTYARRVIETSEGVMVQSLYEFPSDSFFITGQRVPTISNGKNIDVLEFNGSKSGYIIYAQTLLYNYIHEESGLIQRMNEKINIRVFFNDVEEIPDNWDVVLDNDTREIEQGGEVFTIYNNSLFISKDNSEPLTHNANGRIELEGELSKIKKTIYFNI